MGLQDSSININVKKITNLHFAVDVILIGNSEAELVLMIKELEHYSSEADLTMNLEKTKIIAQNKIQTPIKIVGKDVEQVKEATYLG